ncbi:immunity protein YezG family protein [Acinetobacter populi]|uniref:DUF600 domain-containing protein n=1 Tax=Acinetobacter populi TaxID=1582270 RepID=A0A1Z9YUK1_9GAMM|nr:immunity protein YezG family protein [Acinetobacter populi]OUY05877.1 hypothetical protein CAP51_14240 [Acinetobacter populi]
MEEQLRILNELSRILHFSTEIAYNSAHLVYKFNPDEQWYSFSAWYEKNHQNYSPNNFDKISNEAQELCKELHNEMQAHTGGDWRKFVLTLNEKGEAKTQFIYDIQSCMDEFKDD